MILGIGTDLINSNRVEPLLKKHKDVAISRLMTPQEISFYYSPIAQKMNLNFAKVWAAKEAVVKASEKSLNSSWHDIEIFHTPNGAPFIKIHNFKNSSFLSYFSNKKNIKISEENIVIHLTLTDEIPYVIAMCVIEYNSSY